MEETAEEVTEAETEDSATTKDAGDPGRWTALPEPPGHPELDPQPTPSVAVSPHLRYPWQPTRKSPPSSYLAKASGRDTQSRCSWVQ